MQIALVKFEDGGKNYYFKFDSNLKLNIGDEVVLDTINGHDVGLVVGFKEEDDKQVYNALKDILRVVNEEDIKKNASNLVESEKVIVETKSLIKKHKLNMELLKAEYTLNKEKLTIFFKAEERVDFRNLVRDLSQIYKTRIELRQLGSRDIAKMVGGLGPCGLVLCCQTFIGEFDPVSINMAKNQDLSLNPSNISGICGRLLCCLKYEDDVYEELKENMPDMFDIIHTNKGKGKVVDINLLKNQIKVNYNNSEYQPEWIDYNVIKESR